jgi:cadmium resistance protein CadD (predicted permease)
VNTVLQAVGLFVVTNIDDLALLALLFATGVSLGRLVAGQYVAWAVIAALAAGVAAFVPDEALRWLGLLPIAIGIKELLEREEERGQLGVPSVAAIALAGGVDDVGVLPPVFATGETAVFIAVFAALIVPWCLLARWLATRPPVIAAIARLGRFAVPLVLVAIGVSVLIYPSG